MSLVSLAVNTKLPLHFLFNQGLYIDYNRNQIVDVAIANNSTHLMFIDSDMAFPSDGIEKLLAHNLDIVGGYYNTRRGNIPVRVLDADGRVTTPTEIPAELFPCHVLPTGFMLIRLDVLSKLKRPYFATITHEHGTVGEDVVFCKNAADVGIQVWCDPTIKLGHVGKKIY